MLLLKIEGKEDEVKDAVELARSYGFVPAHRSVTDDGRYQVYMNFGGFGGEVGLVGCSKEYVTDDFRKELVELYKKHKNIFVALTDKRQAETKPAILEFNGTDFDIEIEVKEGVVFPLKARISVTVKVINKSEKEVVLENIGREFLFTLLVRDMADNELLELAGNELDTPVNLTIKPGEVYTENITFNINTDTPMCAKLVFQTVTFNYNGNPTFYMMPPLHVILK